MAEYDRLAVKPGFPPMEAKLVDALPEGEGWQYEPKWDGFRCLVFRDGPDVALMSKSGKPLGRYFPEVVDTVLAMEADRIVLDGELVIPVGGVLSFDALQLRLHPAESRVNRLAGETPAQLVLFDLLFSRETSYVGAPLELRRRSLEIIYAAEQHDDLLLSPCTSDLATARGWLEEVGAALDGVVAKRLEAPYQPGERAMLKIKAMRTADCVVGGFRYATGKSEVGSLLLGLYDEAGLLHHVGFTSSIAAGERAALTRRLEALVEGPGFTGDAPGGPSR
ncbi:MAG: hypothetical protein QOJ27_1998, partial [Sphingomonadales bacterium]|nr:hypothetical protein [Sphingomonadales bacterium]